MQTMTNEMDLAMDHFYEEAIEYLKTDRTYGDMFIAALLNKRNDFIKAYERYDFDRKCDLYD
jgi:hypothetical protein